MPCATSGFCLVFAEKAVYIEVEFAVKDGAETGLGACPGGMGECSRKSVEQE